MSQSFQFRNRAPTMTQHPYTAANARTERATATHRLAGVKRANKGAEAAAANANAAIGTHTSASLVRSQENPALSSTAVKIVKTGQNAIARMNRIADVPHLRSAGLAGSIFMDCSKFCLTFKMSHDRGRRDSCCSEHEA